MTDIADTVAPKSDQLNGDDLLGGPQTFTITEVRVLDNAEQPVSIYLAEFPSNRPFKPSKTVRRILIAGWGKKSSAYVGRRFTLYREDSVKFAGEAVGGIRVSHMSHLDRALTIALNETRGKKATHVVEKLPDAATEPTPAELAEQVASALADATTEAEVREWGNRANARNLLDLSPSGSTGTLREMVQTRLDALEQATFPTDPAQAEVTS